MDRTNAFHSAIEAKLKRPGSVGDPASRNGPEVPPILRKPRRRDDVSDPFMNEAYHIIAQTDQLERFLHRVRPLYEGAHRHRGGIMGTSLAPSELGGGELDSFLTIDLSMVRSLSDGERDYIDVMSRKLLERFMKRLETMNGAAAAAPEPEKTSFLWMRSNGEAQNHVRILSEHRRSVVWFLQRRLVRVSKYFKEMQERRIAVSLRRQPEYLRLSKDLKKQAELQLSRNERKSVAELPHLASITDSPLGKSAGLIAKYGMAAAGKFGMAAAGVVAAGLKSRGLKMGDLGIGSDAELDGWDDEIDQDIVGSQPPGNNTYESDDEADNVHHLTTEEQLLLENENELLLAGFESGLDQVRNATQSIQDISALQEQLAYHLQVQEKAIEQLHEDAVKATGDITSANVYLKRAYKTFGEARTWLVVFFLVASGILLFLDWYSG